MCKFYFTILLVISSLPVFSQRVSNVQAQGIGDYVAIRYDLQEDLPGQVFEVALYGSHNGFDEPLRVVRGEIGPNVTSGKGKQIEWGAQKELTQFSGDITFEIRARLTYSPLAILNPQVESMFRRGHVYKLQWKGGLSGEKLRLELIRDGFETQVIDNVINTGSYSWRVSEDVPIAENYRLKITGQTENSINSRTSDLFAIRRQIPLVAKFIPAGILAGAGIIYIVGRLGGSPADDDPVLPPPPMEGL